MDQGSYGRMCGVHQANCGVAVGVGTHLKLIQSIIQVPKTRMVAVALELTAPNTTTKKRGRPKKVPVEYVEECVLEEERTVKAYLWSNGVESCCVGFVSKTFQSLYGDLLNGRIVDVRDICLRSNNESDLRRSKEHSGLVIGIIVG